MFFWIVISPLFSIVFKAMRLIYVSILNCFLTSQPMLSMAGLCPFLDVLMMNICFHSERVDVGLIFFWSCRGGASIVLLHCSTPRLFAPRPWRMWVWRPLFTTWGIPEQCWHFGSPSLEEHYFPHWEETGFASTSSCSNVSMSQMLPTV